MKETDIQNAIRLALSPYGVVIRQQVGRFNTADGRRVQSGVKGLSDLLFIGDGYVAFLEVKADKGKPSAEQLNFIARMKHLNHRAGIVRSVEEALEVCGIQQT